MASTTTTSRRKWSINAAATELQLDKETIKRRLAARGDIEPCETKKFKTRTECKYYMSDLAKLVSSDPVAQSDEPDGDEPRLVNSPLGPVEYEDWRKKKRENDQKNKQLSPVDHTVAVLRPVLNELSRQIDRVPDIAADACDGVTGRGREEIAAALVSAKNDIAKIPERLLRAIKKLPV